MKDVEGWAWVVAVVLLCMATVSAHRSEWRYELADPRAEPFDLLKADEADWEMRGAPEDIQYKASTLTLENDAQKGSPRARREIEVPPHVTAVRLSARVAINSVRATGGRNPGAAIYVADRMPDGGLALGQHYDLARMRGTKPPLALQDIFPLQPQARAVVVGVHLVSVTGRMSVDELRLSFLQDAWHFAAARKLLLLAWGGLALWGATLFVTRAARRRLALAAVGMVAVGGVLFLIPHGARLTLLTWLSTFVAGYAGSESIGDLGHVLIFVLVGVVAAIAAPYDRLPTLLVPLITLAVASEIMQLMTDERSVQVNDALRNTGGAFTGFIVGVLIHLAVRFLRPERRPAGHKASEDGRGAASRA